jgi:predicted metal-dependent hydrolase
MGETIVSDHYAYLLQPDSILPSQYFAALKRKAANEPERRLVIAVLQDAVDCYQKHFRARDRRARQLFIDAEQWITSEDRSWPFSFENVCDLLQINAEYLRRGLATWKERQLRHDAGKPNVVHLVPRPSPVVQSLHAPRKAGAR